MTAFKLQCVIQSGGQTQSRQSQTILSPKRRIKISVSPWPTDEKFGAGCLGISMRPRGEGEVFVKLY